MTGEHDIIEQAGTYVRCRCGRTFDCETAGESKARHRMHYQLAQLRLVLEGKAGPE